MKGGPMRWVAGCVRMHACFHDAGRMMNPTLVLAACSCQKHLQQSLRAIAHGCVQAPVIRMVTKQ
jgi:hypothetical protein